MNIIYWGTVQAKANLIDTNNLFKSAQEHTQTNSEDHDNYHGDENDGNEKKEKKHKLNLEDKFLLFMMRLKLGLTVIDLSFRFNIAESSVSTIITTWLNYLYIRMGQLKTWPHRNILIDNMPPDFKEKYPNNIVIIDCTEIKIEMPSSFVKQSQSYSSYKSTNTLKGLVGVDAKGGSVFIAQLYTGSISDKQIVTRSGFLNILKQKLSVGEILPNDSIMADKGFDIESELKEIGLQLNIPPFLGSKSQFEESDVLKTQSIAHHRIDVERAIGKVRRFGIFSKPLPISVLGSVNQLWAVCCMISNFMDPIL